MATAQPLRRIPFNLRNKVDKKIKELVEHDIIEEIDGPTPWLNPVVIVPKLNGSDIRLCIDMRRANEANVRGRYPLPTVDELLHNMNGSKVFSKTSSGGIIYLKRGHHLSQAGASFISSGGIIYLKWRHHLSQVGASFILSGGIIYLKWGHHLFQVEASFISSGGIIYLKWRYH